MKSSALEFRLRILLHAAIYALGFWAPWNRWLHLDPPGVNVHVWGLLAANLAGVGFGNLGAAFNFLLTIGILCACLGALLRTWGSAYLGASIVQSGKMHASTAPVSIAASTTLPSITSSGPYRFLRNPLYVGTFLHTLALSLLMPRSGAIFSILAIALLQIRLVLGEEAFLSAKLGESYRAYRARVPRFLPLLRPRAEPARTSPRWGQAVLGEMYMWGVAASFAFFGWRYNAVLLIQCVVVSFGLSLVLRAIAPSRLVA